MWLMCELVERRVRHRRSERDLLWRVDVGPPRGGVTGRPPIDGGAIARPLVVREHIVERFSEPLKDRVQRVPRLEGGGRAIGVHEP